MPTILISISSGRSILLPEEEAAKWAQLIQNRFTTLRMATNLSKRKIASKSGVSVYQIEKIETAYLRCKVGAVKNLCKFYKIDHQEVINFQVDKVKL